MMKIDTTTLTDIINKCFANATDGRFTAEQRAVFLADGKRLRGLLLNLLSAQFNAGTPQLVAANAQLQTVNADLKASVASIAQAQATLNNVAQLVGTLDGLLGVAASFV